jgi:hypothetical protein
VQFTHRIDVGKVVVQARLLDGIVIQSATVSASSGGGALQVEGTVSGNTAADISFRFATPVSLDTVRITVNGETFDGSPRIEADIAEIRFYDRSGHLIGNP